MDIRVESLNISEKKGTEKHPLPEVEIDEFGIVGDAHAGSWHRQVSILGKESIDSFSKKAGFELRPGEFAENISISGMDFKKVAILDRFKIGEVTLEVTQIGKKCHGDGCAVFSRVGECVMPKEGLFARVITPGKIKKGDSVEYLPRTLDIHIITLSDRASRGEYEDLSGLKVDEMTEQFFAGKRWHIAIDRTIIPDEISILKKELMTDRESFTDVVITTGGTGIGPRDITVDIVLELADKLVPGIMDNIRIKYGEKIPNALLSRSVAAIMDKTIVFTLPGSVKAVSEYMEEILKVTEHMIKMLHGIGH